MTAQQGKFKVLLIGDACIDYYVFVHTQRQNPENDSPLYTEVNRLAAGGMGRNVHKCLTSLEVETDVKFPMSQSEKVRLIDIDSGHTYCRIDKDQIVNPVDLSDIINLEGYNAIVISDYNKGFVSTDTIRYIRSHYKGPVFLDTKKRNLGDFSECYIKVNEKEAELSDSLPCGTVVTKGNKGAQLVDYFYSDCYPALEIQAVDTCGAGDAFLAGYVYGYLKTGNVIKGIEYGIVNSGISVSRVATYAPKLEELEEGLEKYAKQCV